VYPRILYLSDWPSPAFQIVWDIKTHGELGHAGWQAEPVEGKKYLEMLPSGKPGTQVLDFTRPKAE